MLFTSRPVRAKVILLKPAALTRFEGELSHSDWCFGADLMRRDIGAVVTGVQ